MQSFFPSGPSGHVTHGRASFDLPVLYYRDDAFMAFYTADWQQVKAVMPSEHLHPVVMPGRRAVVALLVMNYLETSIGPYGEMGVGAVVVHGPNDPLPILPLLFETHQAGFGMAVLHLPVTSLAARDAGRGAWGYAKFTADMRFSITPEYRECHVAEGGRQIARLRVANAGLAVKDDRPWVTFSVKDKNLLRTVIPQRAIYRRRWYPADCQLELGDHPVAAFIRKLQLASRPMETRTYLQRFGILPAGEVVENGVGPMDGFAGCDREGEHAVCHGAGSEHGQEDLGVPGGTSVVPEPVSLEGL